MKRLVAGLAGLGVAAVAALAAIVVPWPSYSVTPPHTLVEPVPTDQQRVCPGPFRRVDSDSKDASEPPALGATSISAPEPRTVLSSLGGSNRSSGESPALAMLPFRTEKDPLLGVSQSQNASDSFVSGFAAASCSETFGSVWIVGGSTAPGRTSLILLTNPDGVDATVNLSVYGPTGENAGPGATGIRVPPRSQRALSLASIAPDVAMPVVRMTTQGGSVVATVQHSIVRGLAPGGVELVGATAPPSRTHTIPGVTTVEGEAVRDDRGTLVRVLAPGDRPAHVTVDVVPDNAAGTPRTLQITADPAIPVELPLTMLPSGTYTVTVSADEPVVAAARSTLPDATDFAWHVAPRVLSETSVVAIAKGPSPTLYLSNTSSSASRVTVTSRGGAVTTHALSPRATVAVPVTNDELYTLVGAEGLVASVTYNGDRQLSALTVNPANPLAAPLDVYPD